MQAERWKRLKDLFAAAVERPASQREDYVREACGDDPALRHELLELLQAEMVEDGFIEQPAADDLGWAGIAGERTWIGRQIGPYRIVDVAGRGGLSRVYRAVQEGADFERQVAIKLLRPGYGGGALQRRFRAEGRMLAALSHPNIAHFLDAGATDDGAPFLVLEYVEGQPLDAYCESNSLSLAKRIDLFRVLCGAVHYVHQHLMVHGDLKGSNVLVTGEGTVKLLDFGIARLLAPNTASGSATHPATLMLLTPDYASPEQLRGEPLTTASDIYSLGALLYRLLTGRTPYGGDQPTPAVMMERLTTGSWTPPDVAAERTGGAHAEFARTLRGDLAIILRKALRVDVAERYASAQELADDLHRWQRGFPIEARPDSMGYRISKWARRHRAAALSATVAVIALVGGIASTSWQAHQARLERERAERNFNAVRELSSVFLEDVYKSIAKIPGSTEARKLLVDNALKYLQALERGGGGSLELRRDLATAYQRLGDVQGALDRPSLNDQQASNRNYQKAVEIRASIADEQPVLRNLTDLLNAQMTLVESVLSVNDVARARYFADEMARTADRVRVDPAADRGSMRNVGGAYVTQGWMQWSEGKPDVAIVTLAKARDVYQKLALEQPDDVTAQRDLAFVIGRIGKTHAKGTGRLDESMRAYEQVVTVLEPVLRKDPNNADVACLAIFARLSMGELYNVEGQPQRALQNVQPALREIRHLHAIDPIDQFGPFVLAGSLNTAGESHLQLGDYEQAQNLYQEAVAMADVEQVADVPDLQLIVASAKAGLARAHAGKASSLQGPARGAALREAERIGRQAEAMLAPLAQSPQTKIDAGRQLDALRQTMGWPG